MNISNKIRHIVLWVMLTIIAVAYTGKALHTHSDSYYDALRTTKSAAANGMSNDCPICHFNLLLFYYAEQNIFTSFITLLTIFATAKVVTHTVESRLFFSLRAPPILL